MNTLLKCARNELVFGSSGQTQPKGIKVGRREIPRKTLGTLLGSAVGYAIPTIIDFGVAARDGREIRSVSFRSMVGAGLGGAVGRKKL